MLLRLAWLAAAEWAQFRVWLRAEVCQVCVRAVLGAVLFVEGSRIQPHLLQVELWAGSRLAVSVAMWLESRPYEAHVPRFHSAEACSADA